MNQMLASIHQDNSRRLVATLPTLRRDYEFGLSIVFPEELRMSVKRQIDAHAAILRSGCLSFLPPTPATRGLRLRLKSSFPPAWRQRMVEE